MDGTIPADLTPSSITARSTNLYLNPHDNLLYHISSTPELRARQDPVPLRLCVPLGVRRRLLEKYHDDLFSAHPGMNKMKTNLQDRYWWPSLHRDVANHIQSCETCQKAKEPPLRIGNLHPVPIGSRPWERVAIDFIGPLTASKNNGYRYILVVIDYFTKWAEAFPLVNLEADSTAQILVEQVFCRYGIPLCLHSDRGQPFSSELIRRVCKILGILKTYSSPYWPPTNGRFVKTISGLI